MTQEKINAKILEIENLLKQLQEDQDFAQKLSKKTEMDSCIAFLKEYGYDFDEKDILLMGNVFLITYAANNEQLPDELLEQIVGGSKVGKGFTAFFYGCTHPFSSLVNLCSKKGRAKLAKNVENYSIEDFGDHLINFAEGLLVGKL